MTEGLRRVLEQATSRWAVTLRPIHDGSDETASQVECQPSQLAEVCTWLFSDCDYSFGSLIVEQRQRWDLRYVFYGGRQAGRIHVTTSLPPGEHRLPSISRFIPAVDWHEREAEDLFGLDFEGHPRLGDFMLHNDVWQEGIAPMRKSFNGSEPVTDREPDTNWRPRRIVEEEGAFAMPVGPVHSVATAPVYFQLETVGEDVIRTQPRLFYAYRGVEKIAEGRRAEDVLLIAERISGTSAFAHSMAFCQSVEHLCQVAVPQRALSLRVLLAELERLRHHVAAIAGICESTGLAVSAAQAAILEEDLLRISGALTGHRYLFGLNVFGGLSIDLENAACSRAAAAVAHVSERLAALQAMLSTSSSFLDRLEEVGIIALPNAHDFGLLGPIARASGLSRDLREAQPYCGYDRVEFLVPHESEGDGYARLRLFFREAQQSAQIISAIAKSLPVGRFRTPEAVLRPGAALGWVEAPGGAALHWVRLSEQGIIDRYRIVTPSFANWHGFRLAAENFAFQDFPIILATFALSVHENDR
jgi:formate hydrogenlyase subunit 5